jgi:hypothetical protein
MVLVAPAPTARPEIDWEPEVGWPSDGGSGNGWGGHDGGEGGGGGWWSEEPDEWEANADADRRPSALRRALTLLTVLVLGLASVGGYVLLLIGGSSGVTLASRVLSVGAVPTAAGSATSARVAFSVTNATQTSSGARCELSVFGPSSELGSTSVLAATQIETGSTEQGSTLVPLDRAGTPVSATVSCRQASVFLSK